MYTCKSCRRVCIEGGFKALVKLELSEMVNTDVILQALILVLIAANVLVLLTGDRFEQATCNLMNQVQGLNQDTSDLSRCDISFLPDKCSSLLNDVDLNKGLVLGKQREKKVFLTVGVAVWDDHVNNIGPILSSLIKHVTQEDASDIIIVISVSQESIFQVQQLLNEQFSQQVDSGLIHLISPTVEYVNVLSRREPLGQVYYKEYSKDFINKIIQFNKNMGFVLFYSHRISDFVFHISDQTITNGRFLPEIKNQVQKNNHSRYFAIVFSDLNVYPSSALQRFSEFYAMFGLNSSPDIVYNYRSARQSRASLIDSNTQLFSNMKDTAGKRSRATLETSLITTDQQHTVDKAYSDEYGFFWSMSPKANDYVQVTFTEPINLSRVVIVTGSVFLRDTPSKAVLLACAEKQAHRSCDLDKCKTLTTFGDPIQDLKNLQKTVVFPVKCLRMEFISKLDNWLIIRDISVWTD